MKKATMAIMIAACIALCAAVWPQSKVVKETPVPPPTPAVCATEAAVSELKTEVQPTPTSEKEKDTAPPTEASLDIPAKPEPAPSEIPAAHQEPATPKPTPEPIPEPPTVQKTVAPQTGDMVYVPGFGWIENQGPNRVEYAADMYENGNKIGSMG